MRLFVLVFCLPFLTYAQKVKIKKEDVFIDKVLVGTVTKAKDSLGKTLIYKNTDGVVISTYGTRFVGSPIEGPDDDGYHYSQLAFPEFDINYGLNFDDKPVKFTTQTRKGFVKSLVKKGYVGADGKVIEDVVKENFIGPAMPELVSAYLKVEEEQMQHLDYILERDMSKNILLKSLSSKKESKQFLGSVGYSYFFMDDYEILHGGVLIGTIKVRYRAQQNLGKDPGSSAMTKASDPKGYFFNTKGGRVAWSGGLFHDLKIHKSDKRLDKRSAKFLAEENDYKRFLAISKYLVEQGAL